MAAIDRIMSAGADAGLDVTESKTTRVVTLRAPDHHRLHVRFDAAGRLIGAQRHVPGGVARTLPATGLETRALTWITEHAPEPVAIVDGLHAHLDGTVTEPTTAPCGLPAPHASHWRANANPTRDGVEMWCDGEPGPLDPRPPLAPASRPERGADAFDEVERSDRAAAEFERTAGRRRPLYDGSAATPLVTVDVHGPADQLVFELGRWDEAEQAHVHLASLSRQELADLVYNAAAALSRTTDK